MTVSGVLFPLITAPYVTRILYPEDLGLYNFASTYAHYFSMIALLGIPNYGPRTIGKVKNNNKEANYVLNELFTLAVISGIIISFVYVCSIFFVEQFRKDYVIFLIAGFIIYLMPISIDWFFQGLENFKLITVRTIVIRILSIVLLFVVVNDAGDLIPYLLLSVFSCIVGYIWNFTVLYRSGYKIKFVTHGIKKHVKPLFLLLTSSLAVYIYTALDTIMLGLLSDYIQVAYYSYAMHISKGLLAAVTSLSAVMLPRVSYYVGNNMNEEVNLLLNKSFSFVSFMAIPICVGIIIIAPVFVPLFFGENYIGSVIPLQILSGLIIAIGLNNLFAIQCLVAMGYDKLFLYCVLTGTFSNFFLNLIMIPYLGATGASIASVIAEILVLIASYIYVKKKTFVRVVFIKEITITIVVALMFYPIYKLLANYATGWWLVGAFVILSMAWYIVIQYFARNSTAFLICQTISGNINKLRNKNNEGI